MGNDWEILNTPYFFTGAFPITSVHEIADVGNSNYFLGEACSL